LADGGNWIRVAHPPRVLLVLHLHQHLRQDQLGELDHRLILLVLQHPLHPVGSMEHLQYQSGPILIPKFLLAVLLVRLVLLVLLVQQLSDSQSSRGLEPTKMKGSHTQALSGTF
jgi:hypothetical protein